MTLLGTPHTRHIRSKGARLAGFTEPKTKGMFKSHMYPAFFDIRYPAEYLVSFAGSSFKLKTEGK